MYGQLCLEGQFRCTEAGKLMACTNKRVCLFVYV